MVPRILVDTAPLPGGGELRLIRRGEEFSIMLRAVELMNSRRGGSEEALAALACAALSGRARPRVLIGGLGMGFTLRAALAELPEQAEVAVAELLPAVVEWARGPMAGLCGAALDDPRVRILVGDVAGPIASGAGAWDAILLDVDNGPDGLTLEANNGLYSDEGLAASRRALARGGVLAVWSAHPDAAFAGRLRRAGFTVEEHVARSGGRRGARHVVWLARRPSGA